MTSWHVMALFTAAGLLFVIQPAAGRAVLPALGGAAATWTTCMLFFQAMLLVGYAWAHLVVSRLPRRGQFAAHFALLGAGAWLLPPRLGGPALADAATQAHPAAALLLHLTQVLGLPVIALAATSPLLQRWYAGANRPGAENPYFLYAASNAGSLAALLAYPLFIEPWLGLEAQRRAWSWGYAGFILLLGAAVLSEGRRPRPAGPPAPPTERIRRPDAARWLVLAAVPSSLSLGVTLHLATDLASAPLLWVLPLALYLASYMAAFARRGAWLVRAADRALPFLAAAAAYALVTGLARPAGLVLALHLAALFAAGLVCHGRLAAEHPPAERLTGFYLCLAAGGALGGVFNALLAPLLFRSAAEYPLALVLACALRPPRPAAADPEAGAGESVPDLLWTTVVGAAVVAAVLGAGLVTAAPGAPALLVAAAVPCALAVLRPGRVRRVALGLGAVLLLAGPAARLVQPELRRERSFFGVTTVKPDPAQAVRQLVHGSTLHGAQWLDPAQRRTPLAYYHRTGPLGEVMRWLGTRPRPREVGVVGLGAGTMAAYAEPGDVWRFHEIDPASIRVATDTNLFTYLADCRARWSIVPGDARLRLAAAPDAALDLLALDAFSSDAIPLHLLTREALELYLRKLRPGGVLAFHLSNRYADLEPALAALARDAGLAMRVAFDEDAGSEPGKLGSHWAVLAADATDWGTAFAQPPWHAPRDDGRRPWTDDHASLMEVLVLW
jgi:SAM-dependent methyltransferase